NRLSGRNPKIWPYNHTVTDAEWAAAFEQYRGALRAHCYRMLGSFADAEDAVQDTLLRAWRAKDSFEGRAQLGTWLYRIATNVCIDRNAARRVLPIDVVPAVRPEDEPRSTPPLRPELPWLTPYPDPIEAKERIELAFLVALQQLPVKQRAILLLCDVVGWTAQETAALLEMTVPAVTSALQRAHAAMPARPSPPTEHQRELLDRYIEAWHRGDAHALTALLADDVRFAMPPAALWFDSRSAVEQLFVHYPMTFHGHHRFIPISANNQLAVATYLCPHGGTEFRFGGIHVLTTRADQISEITSFGAALCTGFDLPMIISAPPV
ncbi:MAG TPA: RNA polymerase subunit sigma-70, partial [Kofleriaceae bacterium]